MNTVLVQTQPPYPVHIGGGLLEAVGGTLRRLLPDAEKLALVTDDIVAPLWAQPLENSLRAAGYAPLRFVLPHGEAAKSPEHFFELLNGFAVGELTRSDVVLSLGGGAVSDAAGFAAAAYLRGVPFVTIPTTLLAMVDAAVGGKTAINLPAGKNLAGAFSQPAAVFCDMQTLNTLPDAVFAEGCGEILKYAVLGSRPMLDTLLRDGTRFHREAVIAACIAMKAALVAGDEHDRGQRRLLNLGHTVGHAVEVRSGYSICHGFAVAMGLALVAHAAAANGLLPREELDYILSAYPALGLPDTLPYPLEELLPGLRHDKKRLGTSYCLIVPEQIGRCRAETLDEGALLRFLKAGLQ